MRVLLRADAGPREGAGHVMRCVSLAQELARLGHEALFAGTVELDWLVERLAGYTVLPVTAGELGEDVIRAAEPDAVVLDSYTIEPARVSALDAGLPVLAVVDGDHRGYRVSALLDPNLGAERDDPSADYAGADFALVRQEVLAERGREGREGLVAVLGGADPDGAIVAVAEGIAAAGPGFAPVTVVAQPAWHDAVRAVLPAARVVPPTTELPALLGGADTIVSAAGSTAWDVATLGIPAVLIALAENQRIGLAAARDAGIAATLDWVDGTDPAALAAQLAGPLSDPGERERMTASALALFNGLGAARAAAAVVGLVGQR